MVLALTSQKGTGKSFIGALLAKCLVQFAHHRILVVCYTNHALDQFLEDLLDNGISASSIVRLGGKSTNRTEPLSLHNALKSNPSLNFNRNDWDVVNSLRSEIGSLDRRLKQASEEYTRNYILHGAIMEHLKVHGTEYYQAFQVPLSPSDEKIVTKDGKTVFPNYLLDQWSKGRDAGAFKSYPFVQKAAHIWKMSRQAREEEYSTWREIILKNRVQQIHNLAKTYDEKIAKLDAKFEENIPRLLSSKRIVGCTTTAAAKYRDYIHKASPDVLLVEEAGEILESHIITALGQTVKKLILIGDHRYLIIYLDPPETRNSHHAF